MITNITPVSCKSCYHYTRGHYCGIRHENTEPDDGCGSWQSPDPGDPFDALRAAVEGADDTSRNRFDSRRVR